MEIKGVVFTSSNDIRIDGFAVVFGNLGLVCSNALLLLWVVS